MKRLLVLAALLAFVMFPVPASGATPAASIGVDGVRLLAKGLVAVDVTVTCQRPVTNVYRHAEFDGPFVSVDIVQAIGSRHAYGWGWADLDAAALCDGASHAMSVLVVGTPDFRPLKPGRAIVSVAMDASYYWWNDRTGADGYVSQSATTDPVVYRIRR